MPPVPARPEHYVIVGGTTGSGRVLTRLLSAAGHRITVLGRHEPPESRSSPGVRVERVDLMDTQALLDLATRLFKNGDITNHLILFQRYRDAGDPWLGELATTLTATKLLVECFASQCLTTANHAIVAIGSSAVSFVASEQPVGYHAAKAALAQIIRYYAVQLGPLGVRANLVSPALVLKEESRHSLEADARLMETYKSITPLGRIGLPEDVAQLIIFLCSPAASFITGQDIAVDGGISLAAHASLARTLHESSQTPKPGPS